MDSSTAFYLFLTIIFGLMLLGLVLGYQNTERERLREKEHRAAKQVPAVENIVASPRFINESTSRHPEGSETSFDDAVVVNLESYLKSERDMVTQFINDPSVASLYREKRVSAQPN
jgi:hypothetical protein